MQNKNALTLFIKESWLLLLSSLIFGLLLAGVNIAWKPRIEANEKKKITDALSELIADSTFGDAPVIKEETVVLSPKETAKIDVYKGQYDGKCTGWAFTATGAGYADKISLLIAVDPTFEHILGYKVLFSNETTGFGDKIKTPYFIDQFKDAPAAKLEISKLGDETIIDNNIIAISGATISSNAMVDIFNKYLPKVKELMLQKGLL